MTDSLIFKWQFYSLLIICISFSCSGREKKNEGQNRELMKAPLFVMVGVYIDCNSADSTDYFAVFNLICCDTNVRIEGDDDYPMIRMGDSSFVFSRVNYTNDVILKARMGTDFCYPSNVYKLRVRNTDHLGRNDFIHSMRDLLLEKKIVLAEKKRIIIDSIYEKTPMVFENGNYVSDW